MMGISCGPYLPLDFYKKASDGVKPALGSLTKVAALPGSGAGYFAALPVEKNETRKPTQEQSVALITEYFANYIPEAVLYDISFPEHDELVFPPIDLGPGI